MIMSRTNKYIILFSCIFCLIVFSSILYSQENSESEELNRIIQEATLNLYSDPIAVIQIGDSLYNSSKENINNKVTGLLLISDAFIAIRNYPQALQNMNSAKELLGKNILISLKIKILNRFAYQHFQLHLYDEALKYLNEANKLNEANREDVSYLSNKGYINVVRGLIYRQQVGCDVAMRYFERGIDAYNQSEEEITKINLSIIHYNIGNCYLTMENYDDAKKSFELAYYSANKYGSSKNSLKLFAEKGIASYYYLTQQYQLAIETLNTLNEGATKIGDKSLMRSVSADLASNYLEISNWDLFEMYNEEYKKINKELKESEIKATTYALDDIDLLHKLSLKEINNSYYKKIVVFTVFVLISFVISLLLILKKKQKINNIRTEIFKTKK